MATASPKRSARKILTTRGIESMKAGKWLSGSSRHGSGSLAARRLATGGVQFYFRYTLPNGARDALALGNYDPDGRKGLTLQQASDKAGELSKRYQSGERELRRVIEAEAREAERLRREAEHKAEAEQAMQSATLGALIAAYVANLKRQGKVSWREVESAARLHIHEAWPKLWATPAERVTPDDLLAIITRLSDAGKLREAGKMRSYLRAAYGAAIKARRQGGALLALREMGLSSNPVRDLEPVEGGAGRTRKRALSLAELRAYWRRLADMPGTDGALLRFHLLTGGQRVKQLSRLVTADHDTDLPAIRLRDSKGKRKEARIHVVPMVPAASAALKLMTAPKLGPHLFSIDGGETGASYFLIQTRIRAIVAAMAQAGELENGPFTAGDLRRTVESRLAGAGVSQGVRAQLQSHGLGGVQARHYDQHDYIDEKRSALETLHRLATGESASVVPLKRGRRQ